MGSGVVTRSSPAAPLGARGGTTGHIGSVDDRAPFEVAMGVPKVGAGAVTFSSVDEVVRAGGAMGTGEARTSLAVGSGVARLG